MSGIDWRGLMQAGLHGLGLEPAVFWFQLHVSFQSTVRYFSWP